MQAHVLAFRSRYLPHVDALVHHVRCPAQPYGSPDCHGRETLKNDDAVGHVAPASYAHRA